MGLSCSKDMAVCLVIFNPAKSKKIIQNYYETVEALGNVPIFTLELVFHDREPEIPDALHMYSTSFMFHKERLYRLLEPRVPARFKKLAFLDADLLFDFDWYQKTSRALDFYDVVQMFSEANWMNSKKEIILTRRSVLEMKSKFWDSSFHPGFAWGMRREWYQKVGFFDWAVSGSGDTLSSIAWLDKIPKESFQALPRALRQKFEEFQLLPKPLISHVRGSVRHLFHGSRENRQYTSRHQMLDVDEEIVDMIEVKGAYEWKDLSWNKCFLEYFISRNDDEGLETS